MVDDILNTDNEEIDVFVKKEFSKIKRVINLDDDIL